MTTDEFRVWLDRRGWGVREAARRLGVQPARITEWRAGRDSAGKPRKVPPYILAHMRTLDKHEPPA